MNKFAIVAVLSAAFIVPAQSQSYSFSLGQDQPWANDFAQAKKSQKRTKQKPRTAKQPRQAATKPCVAYHWTGCLGWDPDPHVRFMIRHDSNIFDD